MSGHQYINSHNLFADDDDIDDETFLRGARTAPPPVVRPQNDTISQLQQQRQAMLERQREIEQRTLDSSKRSVDLLRDSERVGVATAEELLRQREQLENTSKRLDEINTNLRYSQKHLNGIKSVFSGLKNYLTGRNDQTPRPSASPASVSRIPEDHSLHDAMGDIPPVTRDELFNSHPATRLRGLDEGSTSQPVTDSRRVNELLDANLDEMMVTINRLKGLGSELGKEIDTQNHLIDNIHDKVETADLTLNKQSKQMNKLLGK